MIRKGRIALVVSLIAIILATGATTALASNGSFERDSSRWSSIWSILTEDQKAQLVSEAEEKMEQYLADGRITQEQYDQGLEAIQNGDMPFFGRFGRGGRGDWTDEQRAAMDTMRSNREAMRSRWDALTDEQRAEIYDLEDQKTAIDSQIIDRYLEFGVVDSEDAESMRNALESRRSEMRENGRMPMGGGRGMRGGRAYNGN